MTSQAAGRSAPWIGAVLVVCLGLAGLWNAVIARRLINADGFFGVGVALSEVLALLSVVLVALVLAAVLDASGRRVLIVGCGALTISTICVTAVASGNAWGLVVAGLIMGAAWQCGDWLLKALRVALPAGFRLGVALAGGFSVFALVAYAAGMVGALQWWSIGLATVAVAGVALVRLTGWLWRLGRTGGWRATAAPLVAGPARAAVAAAGLLVVAAASVWTAAPEIQYDPLWGKEWLPSRWADFGQIMVDPQSPQTFLGGSTLYMTSVGHALGAEAVGRYLSLGVGVALAGVAWGAGRRLAGPNVGAILALLVLLTPHVIWQMSTADDDLVLSLLVGGLALLAVGLKVATPRHAFLVGLIAGGAFSAKLHLAVFAGIIALGWLLVAMRGPLRSRAAGASGLVAGAALTAGIPLIVRWLQVGNPVYPAFNNVFRSPSFPPTNETWNFPYAKDGGILSLVRLPFDVIGSPTTYMEMVPAGVFGLLPVVLLIFALTAWWRASPRLLVVWVATLAALVGWWLQMRYLRYLLPYAYVALLMSAIPLGAIEGRLTPVLPRWARRAVPLAALVVFLPGALITAVATFWNIPERVPLRVAVGIESADTYRHRLMPSMATIAAINHLTPPSSGVVVDPSLVYQRALTTQNRHLEPSWEFLGMTDWAVRSGMDPGPVESVRTWARRGIRWVAISVPALEAHQYDARLQTMVRAHGTNRWTDGTIALFELR